MVLSCMITLSRVVLAIPCDSRNGVSLRSYLNLSAKSGGDLTSWLGGPSVFSGGRGVRREVAGWRENAYSRQLGAG